MIRLAMLLVGAPAFRRRWWLLPLAGVVWIGLGAFLVADATDGELRLTTDAMGLLLVLEGVLTLLTLWLTPADMRAAMRWRALILLALGGLILLPLDLEDEVFDRVLFGAAFLIDGALRLGSAWVVRFRGWQRALLFGALQFLVAFVIMGNWPIHHSYVVPMVLGFVLISSGWALSLLGVQLRNLVPGASITALPIFFARGWYGPARPPRPHTSAPDFDPQEPMTLYVWTAQGSAQQGHGPPLVRRYIAAIDAQGVVSTGHSALEVRPDVYISHYPAVEIDHAPDDFAAILRAGPENDIPGRWIPDHATGVRDWVEPDQKVVFDHYDAAALRAFWNVYRQDSTYNLTSRSCSTATSLAIETALEGVLGTRWPLLRFVRLLLDADVWLAAALRRRGATMAWTPGLVLDYARLLRMVVARHTKSRPARLGVPIGGGSSM